MVDERKSLSAVHLWRFKRRNVIHSLVSRVGSWNLKYLRNKTVFSKLRKQPHRVGSAQYISYLKYDRLIIHANPPVYNPNPSHATGFVSFKKRRFSIRKQKPACISVASSTILENVCRKNYTLYYMLNNTLAARPNTFFLYKSKIISEHNGHVK